ncbi:MAG: phosphatase PAP2 family protein [Acidimicrobiales bacterium]
MSAPDVPAAKTSAGCGGTSRGRSRGPVSAFDARVDAFFEVHLRGHKGIDLVMYGASAVGEHSFIWLLLSGTKAWRTKAGRGALMKAGGLLAAESLLVNGIVKSFFRRRRPEAVAPRPLPLRTPRSSSFPSGHASAAFFSAALLRGSGRKWPLYVLAVVVSTSRVHVKIHHASDVVGGAVFGAALGEVVRRRLRLF